MNPVAVQKTSEESAASRQQALLEIAESIAHHRGLAELFHDLAARLHRVALFDYLNLILHDPERQVMRVHILETQQPTRIRPGAESPMQDAPACRVFETQQPFVVDDVATETSFPSVMEMLRGEQVRSFCLVPLTTAQRRLGILGFGKVEHILRVLEEKKWRLGGPHGAATKLGMKRTTLQSRMRKLGITRPR